jgi:uncharacterized protein YqeY
VISPDQVPTHLDAPLLAGVGVARLSSSPEAFAPNAKIERAPPYRRSGGCEQSAVFLGFVFTIYNPPMPLVDQIQKDIVAAMKSKDEARLSTLRMVKSALQLKSVEKMGPLDDKESQAVLNTLIKQRKDSIEQFTKGGRQEMADKEAAEIGVIETYLPQAASEADIASGVKATIAEMGSPTMKDMGTVMKNVMAKFGASGMRVDGKVVSDMVKKELAGR